MDPTSIHNQIERILRSKDFAGKGQLKRLLEVLFRHMDSQAALKPDLVIQELWPEETRTKRSADVATEMNRLRRALESYYSGEGKSDPITISLPNRSASSADSAQAKRWIVATPREDTENPPQIDHLRGLLENRARVLKIVLPIIIAIGLVVYLSIRMLAVPERPVSARLDGTVLRIMNADGQELWSKSFRDGFWTDYYAQGIASRIWFGDLDGDGHTEILLLYHSSIGPRSHSSTLICYSDRGKEKWRWTPGRELPELAGAPATFRIVALVVTKATGNTPPRIVVSSINDPWWPNQIAVLDSNGKVISEYWHSGHLEHLLLADLDGNGKQEIVATGVSNGYHQATMVVLDPDHVSGASTEAARPELQIHGMGAAQERLRLLFPRSDLNKALFVYNTGGEASFDNGRIQLSVQECLQPPGCLMWYQFDQNFHLVTAYADEQFRSTHAQFYANSKDAHTFSPEEQAEFQKVRCLVGCKTEFVQNDVH